MGWKSEDKRLWIGIDPGTHTGLAVYDPAKGQLTEVCTLMIHRAWEKVLAYNETHRITVVVEDARLATYFRDTQVDKDKEQGAGSIKRDCSAWEDFLTDYKIPFSMQRPGKKITKLEKIPFRNLTKYTGRTSKHSRDAAMIVFGRK